MYNWNNVRNKAGEVLWQFLLTAMELLLAIIRTFNNRSDYVKGEQKA